MSGARPARRSVLAFAAGAVAFAAGRIGAQTVGGDVAQRPLAELVGSPDIGLAAGGCLLLIRHASTEPGVGDPPGFDLERCATQRNLSEDGRREARQLGRALQDNRVRIDAVRSSAWCRCKDTASLAFGAFEVWAPVNSFFGDSGGDAASRQTAAVVAFGAEVGAARQNLALVTHQVNITALTGVYPRQAEIVVARHQGGRLVPIARVRID